MPHSLGVSPPQDVVDVWAVLAQQSPPEVRGYGVIGVAVPLIILALILFAARLRVCLYIQKNVDLADWLALIGSVMSVACSVAMVYAVKWAGFDHHEYNLTEHQKKITLILLSIGYNAYVTAVTTIKISVVLYIRRLTSRQNRRCFKWVIWALLAINVSFFLGFSIAHSAGCKPYDAYWLRADPDWSATHEYYCTDDGLEIFIASMIAVPVDFVLAILPTWLILGTTLPARQKAIVVGLFMLMFLPSIAAAIRTYYIWVAFFVTWDFSWSFYYAWIWTDVELFLGVFCANAPALRTIYVKDISPRYIFRDTFVMRLIMHNFVPTDVECSASARALPDQWEPPAHPSSETPQRAWQQPVTTRSTAQSVKSTSVHLTTVSKGSILERSLASFSGGEKSMTSVWEVDSLADDEVKVEFEVSVSLEEYSSNDYGGSSSKT